jgi:site-specific DNA-methyltransferase (adenine-specific)
VIVQGGAQQILGKLPVAGAHTCITSPPYYGLRDYGIEGQIGLEETPTEYIKKLVEVFNGVKRVLRDDGTLWIVIGDSYASSPGRNNTNLAAWCAENAAGGGTRAGGDGTPRRGVPQGLKAKDLIGIPWMLAFALRDAGWYLRQEVIWAKSISGPVYRGGTCMPESVKDRCTKSPRYSFDVEAIKEEAIGADRVRSDKFGGNKLGGDNVWHSDGSVFSGSKVRNRRSVWHVNPKPFKGAHFATFPEELIEPMVLGGAPEGGTVLDPFAGAGTTGVVAKRLGREFFGIELNPEYCALAQKRLGGIE